MHIQTGAEYTIWMITIPIMEYLLCIREAELVTAKYLYAKAVQIDAATAPSKKMKNALKRNNK